MTYQLTINSTTYDLGISRAVAVSGGNQAWVDDYGVNANPGTTDMTAYIQAAINAVAAAGGGTVYFRNQTYIAAGLSLPNDVYLRGQGAEATILKLKDGANTWLVASSQWIANATTVNLYGGIFDMTLDGNVSNNPSGSLVIIASYRWQTERCVYKKSGADGLRLSLFMQDGTTLTTNGMAETTLFNCAFQENTGHGVACRDNPRGDLSYKMADIFILNNQFYNNGLAGVFADRAAGFKIIGNQIYGSGTHGVYVDKFDRGNIETNNIEITGAAIATGQVVGGVYINSFSTQGGFVIGPNVVIINSAADTQNKTVAALAINGTTANMGIINPFAWVDLTAFKGGVQEWRSAAAQASLANVSYPLTSGSFSLTENQFILTGAADTTKKVKFHPANTHATGTTLDFYLRPFSGTFALLETTNLFTGAVGIGGDFILRATAPATYSTTATLTAADLKTVAVQYTGTGHTLTLPTGTALDSGFGNVANDNGTRAFFINTGSGSLTIGANTGVTLVGSATVAAGTSASFMLRKTGTATWVAYRY